MPTVHAAVVQAAPVAFDLEKTLDKVERLLCEAVATGAGLVVFPEAFVSCYPRGLTFGASVGVTGNPPRTCLVRRLTGSGRWPVRMECI